MVSYEFWSQASIVRACFCHGPTYFLLFFDVHMINISYPIAALTFKSSYKPYDRDLANLT
jgi:hypothetical protein